MTHTLIPAQNQMSCTDDLLAHFHEIRTCTGKLAAPLSDADATVQSMPDASPAKWHLGHTSWFFETLILTPYKEGYPCFDQRYAFLFNSYYESLGPRQPRPQRGMLTRPSLAEITEYRQHVDRHMTEFLSQTQRDTKILDLVELGLNHEMQHQELLLTDLLHLFAQNPIKPVYHASEPLPVENTPLPATPDWTSYDGGLVDVGHDQSGFSFDCETPKHQQILRPFKLANTPINNRDWIEFIDDGGYQNPLLWLSDGWSTVQTEGWHAPLYWGQRDDMWWSMTLRGFQPIVLDSPVCHISYYEADAFARWRGHRLPTEFEWEIAAQQQAIEGNFLESEEYRPRTPPRSKSKMIQLYGDVWEWTSSPYISYPGFKPAEGAVAEYNGKFMSGQFVLRGGACTTPIRQMRPTYRNFFYPHQRWQVTGLRLAADF
ncbi:ergothioneine biosynthesis protein EgtB [Sneathiella aquimaris]|uniref:ergothioneine biosynthesis protein EgtB n=1 Tax=Sneathiella aquimaris TaxID=2599305 RepID=UPI00146BEF00|nr:ergothioneine biosynthesis protein EgtB [Sneathiella aquimaris]